MPKVNVEVRQEIVEDMGHCIMGLQEKHDMEDLEVLAVLDFFAKQMAKGLGATVVKSAGDEDTPEGVLH